MAPSEDQVKLLGEARQKAQRLIRDLEARFVEVEANPPPNIPAETLAQGRQAMQNAIAAAKRSLAAMDDALRIAHYQQRDDTTSRPSHDQQQ